MTEPTDESERELRARRAASFGAKAADYAAHRPDYPVAAVRWGLAGATGTATGVLDLAAGTGKLTEGLLALGLDVTAVEPDDEMRAELRAALPGVPAFAGTAERIPLADASVDAVFVAQAFHWFDVGPALTEIARVLRPGGVVTALWNHDDESVPWVAEFSRLVRTGVSRGWAGESALPEHHEFGPFQRERFGHAQRRTAATLVETVATHSHVLVTGPAERAALLRTAREFLAGRGETAHGEFDLPLVTTAIRATRWPTPPP
ncbi:class I SAM-dependent methyltransferase [Amycolatopsis nigrescens]|uniref:class I SAM-dependent methyltransferase n=1 Tax=Amycolatopsis nigrescens TaxID=381445 RepID=UPI0003647718|nr:class I SAM-dependent methyltransferase [Amycolatopsis nigrescens]